MSNDSSQDEIESQEIMKESISDSLEERFEKLIKNYPNNLEIVYGELVDGNTKPLLAFVHSEVAAAKREILESMPIKKNKQPKKEGILTYGSGMRQGYNNAKDELIEFKQSQLKEVGGEK